MQMYPRKGGSALPDTRANDNLLHSGQGFAALDLTFGPKTSSTMPPYCLEISRLLGAKGGGGFCGSTAKLQLYCNYNSESGAAINGVTDGVPPMTHIDTHRYGLMHAHLS